MFLSYASEDAAAAERITTALRAAGIEVWFDKSELRGGDVWDRSIRQQIRECWLFMPIVSANTEARIEGYFRREWKLAVDRTHDLSERAAFLVPVVIDSTPEVKADVPDAFRHVQWTRLPAGETTPPFVGRLRRLLSPDASSARAAATPVPTSITAVPVPKALVRPYGGPRLAWWAISAALALALAYLAVDRFWLSKRTTTVTAAPSFATSENSIAVLPFADMSEKKEE